MAQKVEESTNKWSAWLQPNSWSDKHVWIAVGIITFIGFLVRLINVDGLTLWVDEYVHVLRAKDVVEGTGPLFTNDNNGILYTLFVIPLFKIFGPSAFLSRLPSVLFGAGAIPLTYLLGKRLFNRYVGVLAAIMNAFSIYLIFWSRVSRNYAIFEFFFLVLMLVFLEAFEPKKELDKLKGFWEKYKISGKYLALLPVALILSLISHQLGFFFIFAVGFYFAMVAVINLIKKEDQSPKWNKYTVIGGLFFIFAILIFMPFMSGITRSMLELFLPQNIANWVIPDWDHIGKLMDETPHEAFTRYWDVITYDFKKLYLLTFVGLIAAFFYNKKSAAVMWAFYVFPVVLMSYVFREPYLPRYIIYLYPIYLISIALAMFAIVSVLNKYVFKKASVIAVAVYLLLPLGLVGASARWGAIQSLATVEKRTGNVVDLKLARWGFTNWVQPLEYVKANMQDNDVIFATIPGSAQFYLNRSDAAWFRQNHYDSKAHGYVPYEYDSTHEISARTYENLVETFNSNPRGWLVADYYLYGPLTSPQARDFVFKNMKYHFNTSEDGDVYVFSWDRNQPMQPQSIVMDVGKGGRYATQELNINLPDVKQYNYLVFTVDAEGVNNNQEAVMVFNRSYQQFIPAANNAGRNKLMVRVETKYLKAGQNSIQFVYYPGDKPAPQDTHKGFVIYNVEIAGAG